jgi:cardiolipin synthase A/B
MNLIHQVADNQLMLLQSGTAYFPRLCADIEAAQHSVYLETYIFAPDQTGRMVVDALLRAAERGVVVRVLLDGFGAADFSRAWLAELTAAKVQVQWFRRDISPFTLRRSRMRRLRRMHRKLVVLDGDVAFVGGINIINDISSHDHYHFRWPRLDYAVRVQGAVAGEIHSAMRRLWGVVSWANFRRRGKEIRRLVRERVKPAAPGIALVVRDNLRHRHDIENAYLKAIDGARGEVVIANAYFLPGRSFRMSLIQAAQRGVRVMLLLQGRVEYRV